MTVDFMPTGLETLTSSASTYATSKTSGKTNEEILEELGIPVKQSGDELGLEFEDYLQLMVQQLQNQTMDSTMDTSAMLDQLVQMSTVQMMASLESSMSTVADGVALNYAASLVGKTVTVGTYNEEGKLEEVVGQVTGTGTYQGTQVIFVNGEMYPLSSIMAVGELPDIPEEGTDGSTEGGDQTDGEQTGETTPEV